jgi:hypothetical protein
VVMRGSGVRSGVVRIQSSTVQKPRPSYRSRAEQSKSSRHELLLALQPKKRVFEPQASVRGKRVCLHALRKRTLVGIKAAMRDTILGCCVLRDIWLFERVNAGQVVLLLDAPYHHLLAPLSKQAALTSSERERVPLLNPCGLSSSLAA